MGRLRSCSLAVVAALSYTVHAQTDFSVSTGNLSTWNQSDWSLTTHTYIPGTYQARISLANGYVGASLAAAGPFFEADVNQTNASTPVTNGWPMFDPRISFSTISGFYDVQPNATGVNYPWLNQYGWDSFISGIPHPTDLIFAFNNTYLDATVSNTTISNFVSSVSFKTGVGSWSYTWSPAGLSAQFNVTFTAIFSRVRPNVIAVQATIMSSEDVSGTATDLLDGRSAVRTTLAGKGLDQGNASIYSAVHPNNLPNITGWVVSTADFDQTYTNLSSRAMANGTFVSSDNSTIGQTYTINLKAGQMATFTKYVGVASTDKFSDPETTARQASANAKQAGWSALLAEHEAAWRTLMADDVVDDYTNQTTGALPDNPFLQTVHIGSIASMFYLLMNLQPDGSGLNDNSISVGGLASESYGGQVFWDADYWMAPGLNIVVPDYSKQISNFRVKLHPQALANAAFNGYPNGSSLYSWTTGKYGNCTGTGPCVDYEYHLNYDICFNLLQELNVTQNWTWFGNGPRQIIESTAMMTGQLLMYNSTTQNYWLHNATDPDEYANNVDNPAFTIASASQLLGLANNLREHYGLPRNQTWDTIASDIDFPRAPSNITLEYETMNASVVVKQADVVLMTYPLDYMASNYTAAERVLDLDYYSNRQSPDGPAMTYSIFAIDASVLSTSGCAAWTYTLNAFEPYLRGPWYQFSEQAIDDPSQNGGTAPAFPFLTGHGGALQVAPFGFLGLRTDRGELWVNPSLPPQIPSVKVRRFFFAGAQFSALINSTHTTLTRYSTANLTFVTDAYANSSMPFIVGVPSSPPESQTNYNISVGQSITIPNRQPALAQTVRGNLLQCKPVYTNTPWRQGQFPLAAIDGASATRWQPASNGSAGILIDLTSVAYQRVTELIFDWGASPPLRVSVSFANDSSVSASASATGDVGVGVGLRGAGVRIDLEGIAPNRPFSAAAEAAAANQSLAQSQAEIVPYVGNATVAVLGNEVWTGKWCFVEIEGVYGGGEGSSVGATVGEVGIAGSGSGSGGVGALGGGGGMKRRNWGGEEEELGRGPYGVRKRGLVERESDVLVARGRAVVF